MRPLGVTLVGFYQILRGVLGLLFGLSVLAFTGLAAKLASLAAEGNAVERCCSTSATPPARSSSSSRRPHARRLRRPADAELGTFAHPPVFRDWTRAGSPWLVHAHLFSLLFGAINAVCIFYLAMPPIKRAFHAEGNPMRMAA